jgi:hypothetical protein
MKKLADYNIGPINLFGVLAAYEAAIKKESRVVSDDTAF